MNKQQTNKKIHLPNLQSKFSDDLSLKLRLATPTLQKHEYWLLNIFRRPISCGQVELTSHAKFGEHRCSAHSYFDCESHGDEFLFPLAFRCSPQSLRTMTTKAGTRTPQICIFNERNNDSCTCCKLCTCVYHLDTFHFIVWETTGNFSIEARWSKYKEWKIYCCVFTLSLKH